MAADIAGSIALCGLFGILLISFLGWKVERDKEYKRRYAALCRGDKFFLLDTYNGNKCIIEVKYVNPVGERYIIVTSKGNEYKYGMYEFFRDVLIKNNRYYYEKLDPNTFKNVI
jgi:hypothetical protein